LGDAVYRRAGKGKLRASRAFFEANAARVERAASLLADDRSRDTYRSLIRYRCTRERRYIDPHMQKKKTAYLDRELIVPGRNEVFVDIGGFQGNTSLFFQALCISAGQPAPQCVIFEPDPFNFTRLQKNLPRFGKEPACFQMGLGSERGRFGFAPGKFSMSRIEPSGRGMIEVDTLDHVLECMPGLPSVSCGSRLPVSYIKIDVEGADLEVLRGARETIQKHRPRIAAAIYHSDGHMLAIPEYLHEICPDYRFYVRHYSCTEGETILYCL
ncbi:MAG: FkbM family methyltransferase, partial [Oscillospiraceae bacterium]|nr:FkbM family methyltransferase [Oscillospiraceae bacterium]